MQVKQEEASSSSAPTEQTRESSGAEQIIQALTFLQGEFAKVRAELVAQREIIQATNNQVQANEARTLAMEQRTSMAMQGVQELHARTEQTGAAVLHVHGEVQGMKATPLIVNPAPPPAVLPVQVPTAVNVGHADLHLQGISSANPLPIYQLPNATIGIPLFDGTNPVQEGMSAVNFINYFEMLRYTTTVPYTGAQLIHLVVTRLVRGGRAWSWWTAIFASSARAGVFPFNGDWETFKKSFLHAMRGPREAIQLRVELHDMKVVNGEVLQFLTKFQQLATRLESLESPMQLEDLLVNLARGLGRPYGERVPLDAPTLQHAIEVVTDKFVKQALTKGVQKLGNQHAKGSVPERVTALEHENGDESLDVAEDDELQVARAGRGRGRFGAPGRGNRGKFRGRGRTGRGAPLSPQQRKWLNDGACLRCGKSDHYAADCPAPAPVKEN